jgi:hypothetical protein
MRHAGAALRLGKGRQAAAALQCGLTTATTALPRRASLLPTRRRAGGCMSALLSPELLADIARRCDLRTLACLVCASKELQAVVADAVEEVEFETEESRVAPAWRLDRFPRLKRLTLDLWEGGRQLHDALGLPALRSGLTSLRITLRRERAAEPEAAGWGGLRGAVGASPCLLAFGARRPRRRQLTRPPSGDLTPASGTPRARAPAAPPGQYERDDYKEEYDSLTTGLVTRLPGLAALEEFDYRGWVPPQLIYAVACVPGLRSLELDSNFEEDGDRALAAVARMKPGLWPNLEVRGAAQRRARPAGGRTRREQGRGRARARVRCGPARHPRALRSLVPRQPLVHCAAPEPCAGAATVACAPSPSRPAVQGLRDHRKRHGGAGRARAPEPAAL